jgi:heme-degrading monooxygenase HmoA
MNLITGPPPAGAIAAMTAVEGVEVVPAMLQKQTGPAGHLGPESAGAILLLQATFADEEKFAAFWAKVTELVGLLATAPGFIRRHSFTDGPHYTLIAWWRSLEDAEAFFSSPEHQAAMRTSFAERWQYTHFAGLWQMAVPRGRTFFCQTCETAMPSTASHCPSCGDAFLDPYGGSHVPAAASIS